MMRAHGVVLAAVVGCAGLWPGAVGLAAGGRDGKVTALEHLMQAGRGMGMGTLVAAARVPERFHGMGVSGPALSAAPSGLSGGQLRLPDAAFDPATVFSQDDSVVNASAANGQGMRVNHWWDFGRLGLVTGYYELAGAQTVDTGDPIGFAWQGSAYANAAAAGKAMSDGVSRTSTYGPTKDCTSTIHSPCTLVAYLTDTGNETSYAIIRVNNCTGEVKGAADPTVYDSHSDAINTTLATMIVGGQLVLQAACHGSAGTQSPQPARKPAPATSRNPSPNGFHGNCWSFRGTMWGYAQQISTFQSQYWSMLQNDYSNNYPPVTGGSTPGITQDQFDAARGDMTNLRNTVLQVEGNIAGTLTAAGIKPKNLAKPGPYNWAAFKVFGSVYFLDKATQEEWASAGSGMTDYETAQQYLSNSWDALKQLPCH